MLTWQLPFAGLWSQIKRAPKSKKVRKTYEVAGPGLPDGMPLDERARSIFNYMKKYNYSITETGEVINFQGMYKASKARAAALVTYVFFGAPPGRLAHTHKDRSNSMTCTGLKVFD